MHLALDSADGIPHGRSPARDQNDTHRMLRKKCARVRFCPAHTCMAGSTDRIKYGFHFYIICCLLYFLPAIGLAQEQREAEGQPTEGSAIEQELELLGEEAGEANTGQWADRLRELALRPLNINRAGAEELAEIPGLSYTQARAIVEFREQERPFASVQELLDVRGIGPVTLERAAPFVTAGTTMQRRRDLYLHPGFWTADERFESFMRYGRVLQEQEGYRRSPEEGGYTGSPVRYYQRARYSTRHLSINLTQQKAPGEPLPGPSEFDYTSAHFAIHDLLNLNMLVVGDYSVRAGQGLLLWSGRAFGKGSDVTRTAWRAEPGVQPYTSAYDAGYLRGVAFTYGNRLQWTGFISRRRRTATETDDGTIRFPTESGLHRTVNERSRRYNTLQSTAGARIRWQLSSGSAGVTGYVNRFDPPVEPGQQPWNEHRFHGDRNRAVSGDIRWSLGGRSWFGEAGMTENGGTGWIAGMAGPVREGTEISVVARNYSHRFQSFLGGAFGETSSGPRNERGLYIGWQQRLGERTLLRTYADRFHFPAPRFPLRQASSGYDWLLELEVRRRAGTIWLFQLREKSREEEVTDVEWSGEELRRLDMSRRMRARIHLTHQIAPAVRYRARLEWVRSVAPETRPQYGLLVYQDLRLTRREGLTIDGRVTLFMTDSYSSRVYQFENDLLYVVSNTMLFDRGARAYLLFNWRPSEWLQLWLKVSHTVWFNRETVGSGLNRIDGNRRSDVGIQARIRF